MFKHILLFWGLRLPSVVGATLQGSLFARPFSACSASVWPNGPPCTSLGRLAAAPPKPKPLVQLAV
ncbi:hypothetical protein SapgrDRAFT_0758 [Saprospira grandis DSM 2844]|uniref:Secreted protein n=1 Tax=Saprospira grandis DSM 2844 TaxID=694433 RepID=J0NYA3_9BACT|nr:hypothetical protein SapgrDRAFT_0758 [Saprospira grandis DSM 2844]